MKMYPLLTFSGSRGLCQSIPEPHDSRASLPPSRHSLRLSELTRVFAATLAATLAASLITGCENPVFTPDEPRSQYDRFDAIRDQRAPSHVFDEFGERRPNIRQRLLTLE